MPMLQTSIDTVPAPAAVSPELSDRPRRRRFTVQDKLRILAETGKAAETGGAGAVLRREGVYLSSLTDWRRQRDAGAFQALSPNKRGPQIAAANPLARRERENVILARRLARAEAIIDLQKKSRTCWGYRRSQATARLDRGCRRSRSGQRRRIWRGYIP